MTRRFVAWAIEGARALRYENGRTIDLGQFPGRREAWEAVEYDRAITLNDPNAIETVPMMTNPAR